MSDELISIKRYADLQGITTAAVYKQLKTSLKPYMVQLTTDAEGKKPITKLNLSAMQRDGIIQVSNQVSNQEPSVSNQVENPVRTDKTDEYIEALKIQIALLTEQIHVKDGQIEHLQNMLDHSQQLQGHTQVMLEDKKPKSGILDWLFKPTPRPAEPVTAEPRE